MKTRSSSYVFRRTPFPEVGGKVLLMAKIRKVFSKNLRKLRLRKGFTQERLAEKLGINTCYVQALEGRACPDVKIDTIAALGKVLGAKPKEFLEE